MTSEVGEIPFPDRRLVEVDVVRRLVAGQFPQWGHLPVRGVEVSGWDNQTFRLGERMSVRLPTAEEYAMAVDKEHRWLPVLAPRLPLPISVPLAKGEPGEGFRFSWSVYEWIDGDTAGDVRDLTAFAEDLAGFLTALWKVEADGGPEPGLHNWFRGGSLRAFDPWVRQALETLGEWEAVTSAWEAALEARWDGQPRWFHGDVAPGNLLVREGALSAVIDFGTCGVGDPACDLAIAWTVLSGPSRTVFRKRTGVDPGTWARGRGWALWKALTGYARTIGTDPAEAATNRRVIDEVLADHQKPA